VRSISEADGTGASWFALLVHAHGQTRRAVAYLRWNEGDTDTIAPSLFKGRGDRDASPSDTATEPEDVAAPPGAGAPAAPEAAPEGAPLSG
jgi:hypothetical protein